MKYLYALAIESGDSSPNFTLVGPDENVGEVVKDLFESTDTKQVSIRFVVNLEELPEDDSTAQAIFEHAEP